MREYNVITNRYVEQHEEKEKANIDIQRLEAAKAYWETHDYDLVNASYFDKDKEDEFTKSRAEKALVHGKDQVKKLPQTVQNDGLMYNPINMNIEDEARLNEKDIREKNKKKRYEVRYDAEQMTRQEMLAEQDRLDNMKLNKVSYKRVEEQIGRGHDILTNAAVETKMSATGYMKKQPPAWERVSPKAADA